jgi:hypothetical protein
MIQRSQDMDNERFRTAIQKSLLLHLYLEELMPILFDSPNEPTLITIK